MKLSTKISRTINNSGLKKVTIAHILDVKRASLVNWRNNFNKITAKNAVKLSMLPNCEYEWYEFLLEDDEIKRIQKEIKKRIKQVK